MRIYRIDEGEFEIPDHWADKSVNIFAVGATPPLPLSFVITRDILRQGQDFVEFVEGKLDDISGQLKQFNLIEKRQVEVAGRLALEAEFTWRADTGVMHQRQTFMLHGERIMIFTATAPRKIDDEHRAQVDAVLASVKLP